MRKLLFLFVIICSHSLKAMEQQPAPALAEQAGSESQMLPPIAYLMQFYKTGSSVDQNATAVETAERQPTHRTIGAPAKCPQCARGCITSMGLKRHLKYHNADRPFKCPYAPCDYAAKNKFRRDEHVMAKHKGEKSYKCPFEGCTRIFRTSGQLRYHKYQHALRFECHYCRKKFSTQQNLKTHEASHEEDRPFECSYEGCLKSFKTQSHLSRHLIIHEQTLPHKCPAESCSHSFAELSQLYVHLQRKHHEKNPKLFIQKCLQAAATEVLLNLNTQAQQPSKPLQHDERLSIARIVNPTDQPVEEMQTINVISSVP